MISLQDQLVITVTERNQLLVVACDRDTELTGKGNSNGVLITEPLSTHIGASYLDLKVLF